MDETSEKNNELDEYGVWVKNTPASDALDAAPETAAEENNISEPADTSLDDFNLDSLDSFVNIPVENESATEELNQQPESEENVEPDFSETQEFDISAFENNDSAESEVPQVTEEFSADDFMNDFNASDAPDGDVDLGDFLGGDSSSLDFGDGDIDLGAFLGDSVFEQEKEEQEEIENEDPLDIDLDFEEPEVETIDDVQDDTISYVPETASFDDVSESVDLSDFDTDSPAPVNSDSSSGESVDLSDFGFDEENADMNPVLGDGKKVDNGPQDYEMNIDMEEDEAVHAPEVQTSASGDDEIEIDISTDDKPQEEVAQETDFSSPGDSDFDVDSILGDIEDESGNSFSFEGTESSGPVEPPLKVGETKVEVDSSALHPDYKDGSNGAGFSESDTVEDEEYSPFEIIEEPQGDEIQDNSMQQEISMDSFETQSFEMSENENSTEEFAVEDVATEESSASETDEDISLDDFMGEEGFTDGGYGVTGPYNEDGTPIEKYMNRNQETEDSEESEENEVTPDVIEEPVFEETSVEEPEITEPVFDETSNEEPVISEPVFDEEETVEPSVEFEEPVLEENNFEDNSEDSFDTSSTSVFNEEPDIADVSAYLDNTSDEDDLKDISLTAEDLEKLADTPVMMPEPRKFDFSKKHDDIPDSFDEEAASLSDEVMEEEDPEEPELYSVYTKKADVIPSVAESDELSETEENTNIENETEITEENSVFEPQDEIYDSKENVEEEDMNNELLEKISRELAVLRTEISGLKNEFEDLKKNGSVSVNENELPAEETAVNEVAVEKSCGFFDDTDEDDTIALSGDELSNIMSNAEFTSQDAESITENEDVFEEEIDTGLNVDFDNQTLNEPEISETSFDVEDNEAADEEEEITVPSADDLVVESSDSDLMETAVATSVQEEIEEPVEAVEEFSDTITEDDVPAPTLESLSSPIDVFQEDDDENLETGISEEPVEKVFSSWENSPEEPVEEKVEEYTETVSEEPEIAVVENENLETAVEEEEVVEKSSRADEIPSDMKEEIKSVLSYMDQLLENLPEEKITEFAQSEQFETYKKLFTELGIS